MEGNIPHLEKPTHPLESIQQLLDKDMEKARGIRLTQLGSAVWRIEQELELFEDQLHEILAPVLLFSLPSHPVAPRHTLPLGKRIEKRASTKTSSTSARPRLRVLRGGKGTAHMPEQKQMDSDWEVRLEDVQLRLAAAGENPPASLLLEAADIEGMLGHHDTEKKYVQMALQLNIYGREANRYMAHYYENLGKKSKAMEYLRRAMDAGFEDWQDLYMVADMLAEQGKKKEAHRYALLFLRQTAFHTDAEAGLNFTEIFAGLQDKKHTRKCANQAIQLSKDNEDAQEIFQKVNKLLRSLEKGVQ